MRYVTRLAAARSWRVLFTRGLKTPIRVYFGDAAYGGTEAALVEAKRFRDQVIAIHLPATAQKPRAGVSRNHQFRDKPSELVGVSFRKELRCGRYVAYLWEARVSINGHQAHRSWSVRKHGYTGAFELACAYRRSMTGQPAGTMPDPPKDFVLWAKVNNVPL